MPNLDKSGPLSKGPLTGRGQGSCSRPGYQPRRSSSTKSNPARGLGRGLGPGGGRGCGGSGRGFTSGPPK